MDFLLFLREKHNFFYSFEKLKNDESKVSFLLKVRPSSYLQIVKDQQDYICKLENPS